MRIADRFSTATVWWAIWILLVALTLVLIAQPVTELKIRQPGQTQNEFLDFYAGPLLEPVSQHIRFTESHVTGLEFRVVAETRDGGQIPIAFRLYDTSGDLIAEDLSTVLSSSASQLVFFTFAPLARDTTYRIELVPLDPNAKLQVGASVHDRFPSGAMSFPSNPIEDQDLHFRSVAEATFAEQIANKLLAGSTGYIASVLGSAVGALLLISVIALLWAHRLKDRVHIAVVGMLATLVAGTLLAAAGGLSTDAGQLSFVITTLTTHFSPAVVALLALSAWGAAFRLALALGALVIGSGMIFSEILVRAGTQSWDTSLWIGLMAFVLAVFTFVAWHLWIGHRDLSLLEIMDDLLAPASGRRSLSGSLRTAIRDILSVSGSRLGRATMFQQMIATLGDSGALVLSAVVMCLIVAGISSLGDLLIAIAVPVAVLTFLLMLHRIRTWLQLTRGAHAIKAEEEPGLELKAFVDRGEAPKSPLAFLGVLSRLRALGHPAQMWRAIMEPDYLILAARGSLLLGTALTLTSAIVSWIAPNAELSEQSFWTGVAALMLSVILRAPLLAQLSRRT